MAPTPTMEPLSGEDEWRRMEREHPVMRMTRNDKGECCSLQCWSMMVILFIIFPLKAFVTTVIATYHHKRGFIIFLCLSFVCFIHTNQEQKTCLQLFSIELRTYTFHFILYAPPVLRAVRASNCQYNYKVHE